MMHIRSGPVGLGARQQLTGGLPDRNSCLLWPIAQLPCGQHLLCWSKRGFHLVLHESQGGLTFSDRHTLTEDSATWSGERGRERRREGESTTKPLHGIEGFQVRF